MGPERLVTAVAGPAGPGGIDELLGRVAHGDRAAFAMVYRQVAAPVYNLVRAMTGDDARSATIAAEALTEVWRSASRYTPDAGGGLSWVMKIAGRYATGRVRAGLHVQVVSLALHGGFNQEEIGDLLGLAPQAVASLVRDGLLQLAEPAGIPEVSG